MKKIIFSILTCLFFSVVANSQVINPISAPFLNWDQSPYVTYNLKTTHDKGYHDGITYIKDSQSTYGISTAGTWDIYVGVNYVTVYSLTWYNATNQIGLITHLEEMKENIYNSVGYSGDQTYWDAFIQAIDEYLSWGMIV